MSELIVIGYDDHDTAQKAYEQVLTLQRDRVVDLAGLAVVNVDTDGKIHVDTPGKLISSSTTSGAVWGMLFGVLFLVPFAGVFVGGVFGAVMGTLGKAGINASYQARVRDILAPGRGGVVIMATKLTKDKFSDAMAPFGGELLQTSLSTDDEMELAEGLTPS